MKVAIAGYGVEGEANYRYWSKLSDDITIFDDTEVPTKPIPSGVASVLGAGAFEKIQGFDVVIRTAGLRPDKIHTDGNIWSATNEFFEKCPVPIIGVTGTKGKGTTSTLIARMLEAAGFKTWLVGNIGTPALEILGDIYEYTNHKSQITNNLQKSKIKNQKSDNNAVVVFELSSFQLWDLEGSPQTAVVLTIEPDHQDVHASMEEYVAAKAHIAQHQESSDFLVYHPNNAYAAQVARQSPATKQQYMSPGGAYVSDDQIIMNDVVIAKTEEVRLVGAHNLENVCAAITAVWQYTQDVPAIRQAIQEFQGLPHRLEFVRELDGVQYFNDSYSSAPIATTVAVRAFTQPEILICGGFDRGLNYAELAEAIVAQKNIKHMVLIGQTKEKIAAALTERHFSTYDELATTDLSEIVAHAKQYAKRGDVILFSPGCASFDMFKNFQDRGEQFKKIVEAL